MFTDIFCLRIGDLARAKQVEIERRPIVAEFVPNQNMQFEQHPLYQPWIVGGVARMTQVFQFAGILYQIVEGHIAVRV